MPAGDARSARRPAATRPQPEAAANLPVARVAVDTPLAHLDRPFDYLVAEPDSAGCRPGCRVRVRFAGRLVDGFVLERVAATEHTGRLAFLNRLVSPEPVLAPEIALLARAVADRYAGNLADVLRLAVPPRHARAEAATAAPAVEPAAQEPASQHPASQHPAQQVPALQDPAAQEPAARDPGLNRYAGGAALLAALRAGHSPRVVWSALPGGWPAELAALARATTDSGRGVLVVVPDTRDVARLLPLLPGAVALQADDGPAERYRRFLAVRRGAAAVVIGTRAAMFAPVHRLGLVLVWDEADDLHAEPRAPYPHAREVAALRAHQQQAALVLAGHALSAEAQQLVTTGWARPLRADRATVRAHAPRVLPAGDDREQARDPAASAARLPSLAWRTAKQALDRGPVLVQVPRRGYLPGLSCDGCRAPARCPHCAGPLAVASSHAVPACRWCGRPAAAFRCPACGGARLRAAAYGERRTAEELGRALPGVPVRTSGREQVLAAAPPGPALVVATPGAEPVPAEPGYAAVLLLDGWALLGRPDLRAGQEALRRWMNAAALAAPGAPVVVLADGSLPVVQALVRWDPGGHAERELADRAALGLPPAVRMAALDGPAEALSALLGHARLPASAEVLGPVPAPAGRPGPDRPAAERVLVRVPRRDGAALAAALHAAAAVRSARKEAGTVRAQVDPQELG